MAANEQPDGILLTLIRYVLNIAAVVGSLVVVGGLLFIMVTRAKPSSQAIAGQQQAVQAKAAPTATAPAPAAEGPASAPVDPKVVALGEELFQSQGCGACHTIEGYTAGVVGPNLTNIGAVAGERAAGAGVANAEAYIRQSIVEPNAFIAPECPTGPCPPGAMPANFGDLLSEEQLGALVRYLLTRKGGG